MLCRLTRTPTRRQRSCRNELLLITDSNIYCTTNDGESIGINCIRSSPGGSDIHPRVSDAIAPNVETKTLVDPPMHGERVRLGRLPLNYSERAQERGANSPTVPPTQGG